MTEFNGTELKLVSGVCIVTSSICNINKLKQRRNCCWSCTLPVVHKLCHEFEDRCGAGRVMVPELDGPLKDGHIGWISAQLVKDTSSHTLSYFR